MAKTKQALSSELKVAMMQGEVLYLVLFGIEDGIGPALPLHAICLRDVAKYNVAALGCATVEFDIPPLTIPTNTQLCGAAYARRLKDGTWGHLCTIELNLSVDRFMPSDTLNIQELSIDVS
jgi:hypothetical protein